MNHPDRGRSRPRKPRFTIRAAMIATALVAILAAAVRPLARSGGLLGPQVAAFYRSFATVETAVIVGCVAAGLAVVAKMMRMDETS